VIDPDQEVGMRTWSIERLAALAGVLFIVFKVVGNAIAGSPPKTSASALEVAGWFEANHSDVVASAVFTSIAAPLFLLLLAGLALRLRGIGQGPAAVAAFAFGIVGLTVGCASDALFGVLGRIGANTNADTVQALYQVDGFLTARSLWFAAALGLITAWAAWGRLPQWYAIGSLVVGVLLVIGGLSLRSTGFFSPLNGMTLIAFVALLAWTLATSWIIWRSEESVATAAVTA
jgi:hypothetical protein